MFLINSLFALSQPELVPLLPGRATAPHPHPRPCSTHFLPTSSWQSRPALSTSCQRPPPAPRGLPTLDVGRADFGWYLLLPTFLMHLLLSAQSEDLFLRTGSPANVILGRPLKSSTMFRKRSTWEQWLVTRLWRQRNGSTGRSLPG